jgi:hypothetical protein
MDEALGFRGKSALVNSSADSTGEDDILPRFGPYIGGKDLLLLL